MLVTIEEPFDLDNTLHSGQAFRWRRDGGGHSGVVFGNVVEMRQTDDGLELFTDPDDEAATWPLLRDYLGLHVDLDLVYAAFDSDDRLRESAVRYRGMRVLRQDPWECLVSFICSSASNIPRIARNVESLCESYGRPIGTGPVERNAFPTPRELSRAGEAPLRALGLGYRAAYVAETAAAVADGAVDLMSLREASYEEALDALTGLPGVGDKVANCVLLCALDKPDAFPVDVWIDRALREWYLGDDADSIPRPKMRAWAQRRFAPYAGYANHYLFHDRRLRGRS